MHALTKISPHAIELIGLKDEAAKMRAATNIEEGIIAAKSAKYAAEKRKDIIQSCLDLLEEVISL